MTRSFLTTCAVLLAMAAPVAAQDSAAIQRAIADQLAAQGYSDITVTRTWLGRSRISATASGQTREIVINPRTGEILRDVSRDSQSGAVLPPRVLGDAPRAPESGRSVPNRGAGRPEPGGARGPAGSSGQKGGGGGAGPGRGG